MPSAKEIRVEPITGSAARKVVQLYHYSGKVAQNSQLHLGVLLGATILGVMSFGPPIDRRKVLGLVHGSQWGEMLELNRMAFSDRLPRNSESRALGIAFRLIAKHYPHIRWVLSYADATQCGDGTIYRAAGFLLTGIKRNSTLYRTPWGEVVADKTFNNSPSRKYKGITTKECEALPGFQVRYIKFLHHADAARLAVPVLPYSAISEQGAGMYRGKAREVGDGGDQLSGGGSTPTRALQHRGPGQ